MKCDCLLCSFENPKLSATAVIIRDNKLLVVKRSEDPFRGQWDFVGGYVSKGETPEQALLREIREELGVDVRDTTLIGAFSGTASYKDYEFAVVSFAYLVEVAGDIVLNGENSEYAWVPLTELTTIAFDSNQKILTYLKEKFTCNVVRVRELVAQLDSTATVNEQSLYRAMLDGYVSMIHESGKLIGMGWIFPRQTMLRHQAVVEDMIVDPEQRGKGLGEKILLDLVRWAKEQKVEVIELTTNSKRVAANALYQKVGFKLHPTNHYLLDMRD